MRGVSVLYSVIRLFHFSYQYRVECIGLSECFFSGMLIIKLRRMHGENRYFVAWRSMAVMAASDHKRPFSIERRSFFPQPLPVLDFWIILTT